MGFVRENRYLVFGMPAASILTMVFVAIYFNLGSLKSINVFPNSTYKDWNNRTSVIFTKELESQWSWTYSNGDSKFKQACNTWAHDSLFYAEDELVSYYDNKIITGRDRSYLRDYKGDVLYEVETGSPWETVINMNRILVSYVINYPNGTIVGYVNGQSFIEDDFTINDLYSNRAFRVYRNRLTLNEWQWELSQESGNQFPLSLAVGIASKISFNSDKTDLCNKLYQSSFVCIWVFFGITVILFGLLIFAICQVIFRNNVISNNNIYH